MDPVLILSSGVVDLFRRFPALDWKDRTIIPIIREAIRNLIVDFTAIETIERRAAIDTLMEQALSEEKKQLETVPQDEKEVYWEAAKKIVES